MEQDVRKNATEADPFAKNRCSPNADCTNSRYFCDGWCMLTGKYVGFPTGAMAASEEDIKR